MKFGRGGLFSALFKKPTLSVSWLHHRSPLRFTSAFKALKMDGIELPNGKLEKAYVIVEDDSITISYQFDGKQRNMKREKEELLERVLNRIQLNSAPKPANDKRAKKKQKGQDGSPGNAAPAEPPAPTPTPPEFPVVLYGREGGTGRIFKIEGQLPNHDAWVRGSHLQIGGSFYDVEVNPPTLVRLYQHPRPMTGHPLRPVVVTKYCDPDSCQYRWMRRDGSDLVEVARGAAAYTPSEADLGKSIVVECTPLAALEDGSVREGVALNCEVGPVEPAPARTIADTRTGLASPSYTVRDGQLAPLPSSELRVMTYNLLADQYASQTTGEKVLFAYCEKRNLDIEFRKQVVLQEIFRYGPDLLCMQEVDEKAFREFYQPHLRAAGYGGHFTNKAGGKVREGSAMFFRLEKLALREVREVNLRDRFTAPLQGSVARFQPLLDANAKLAHALTKVTTIGQVVLLEHTLGGGRTEQLVVVNTHLFFHPRASHIRTMHTAALLDEAVALREAAGPARPTVVFCGDLNSDLNDGLPGNLQLMMTGEVDDEWWDWRDLNVFEWGGGDGDEEENPEATVDVEAPPHPQHSHPVEAAAPPPKGMVVTTPLRLRSSCGLRTPYTNFVKTYTGLLDYVLIEADRLEVTRSLPFPPEEELRAETAIPSSTCPSDHMAVVTDLRWRRDESESEATAAATAAATALDLTEFRVEQNVVRAALHPAVLRPAAAALRAGKVVAVPTDTLYGVACCANSSQGVDAIYELKRRNTSVPLAICISDWFYVCRYGEVAHIREEILQEMLPGPFTVLVKRRKNAPLSRDLNPGVETIGIRVPDNDFIREVCREHDGALALTSANLSGSTSTLNVNEFKELWPRLEYVYDGGQLPSSRAGSTIVDLTVPGKYRILREGSALELGTQILAKYGLVKI